MYQQLARLGQGLRTFGKELGTSLVKLRWPMVEKSY